MKLTNRKSLAGGVVALCLILTGTGYAYWTQTLNVTTKAETGDLDVRFVDLGLYAQYINEEIGSDPTEGWSIIDGITREGTNGYVAENAFLREAKNYNIIAPDGAIDKYTQEASSENSIKFNAKYTGDHIEPLSAKIGDYGTDTVSSKDIEISVNNIYPGYAQTFRTDILNAGTLAAKLNKLSFDVTDLAGDDTLNDELLNMLGIAVYIDDEAYHGITENNGKDVFKLTQSLAGDSNDFFTVGNVDFIKLSVLRDKHDVLADIIKNSELFAYPGSDNRMDLFIAVAMNPDSEGNYTTGLSDNINTDNVDDNSQLKNAKIVMKLIWSQFNEGSEVNASNILESQNFNGYAE